MSGRRNHDAGFKARVALEAVKGERIVSKLAAKYGVHPTMLHQRPHAAHGGQPPAEVYFNQVETDQRGQRVA